MRARQRYVGLVLLVALLFVQQAGLSHAVWHELQARDVTSQEDPAPLVHGVCALCSATAALGHALAAPRVEIGILPSQSAGSSADRVAAPDQHTLCFLSRAPPLA